MAPFIGRKDYLSRLEREWERGSFSAGVVYGRRRVGKTELLKTFCRGRRAIFVECIQGSLSDNLTAISAVLTALDGKNREEYRNMAEAMLDIEAVCKEERTVVVFDELPYILATGDHVASVFQHLIDDLADTDTVFLVCGSSMSVMKRETTDYDRPMHGRFTFRMEVKPLSYAECAQFHPGMDDLDRVRMYLTVGGMPMYHSDISCRTYHEFVERHFLAPDADMASAAEDLISAEFAPRDRYMAILNAISDGRTSQKEIAERTGLERGICTRCLDGLMEVGIVDTVHPMAGAPKRPIYRISDPLVAFCQDVVRASRSRLLQDPSVIYTAMTGRIETFLGGRFEDFCAEYLVNSYHCLEIGKWWGVDRTKTPCEIDIVAKVLRGDVSVDLFCECKFTRGGADMAVLSRLREGIDALDPRSSYIPVVFSAYGFASKLEDLEENGGVILIGMDRLTGAKPPRDLGEIVPEMGGNRRRGPPSQPPNPLRQLSGVHPQVPLRVPVPHHDAAELPDGSGVLPDVHPHDAPQIAFQDTFPLKDVQAPVVRLRPSQAVP